MSKRVGLAAAEQAWKDAKDAFQGNLSPIEQTHLAHSTVGDAFKAVADIEEHHASSSRSRKAGSFLRGPLEVVARLSPALDVFSQVEPSILCPIWGSLRIMVMILGKHTEFFDQISSILSRVSEHLPRICDYADLYLASDTLHSILVRTFSNLIRLFLEIHGILKHHDTSSSSSAQGRRSKLKQEALLLLRSTQRNTNIMTNMALDHRVKTCIEQFQRDTSSIEEETRLLQHKQASRGWNKLEAWEMAYNTQSSMHTAQMDEQVIRDFFIWLSADQLTYKKNLERALSFKYPGTCEWIENSYAYAKFCGSSQSSVMWLHGKAGCGKSVMFAHVANVLATKLPVNTSIHELQIYTYMFNTRSSGESTNSFLVMMRALVQQQYLKLQGSKAILPLLKAALGGRSQTHASCDELAKLFTQLTRIQHGPIYVMIDALDEAEEPTEIATWFRHLTTTSGSSLCVKVLATSRRLTNLEKLLKDAIIIAMEPACVDRDIDRFIPSCLVKISDAHCITDPSKLRLIHVALQKGHNGLFLWARLLAELLLSLPSEFHVMKSLDQLPVTLTSLYHQILAGLDAKLATNEPRRRIAQRTISWLCFTRSQVTLGALSEALAIESSDTRFHAEKMPTNAERLIREVLGAFVETLPHGSDDFIVQFVHLSVKEFFLDRGTPHNVADGSGISIYFPVLERANVEMATTLFRYLTFPTHGTLQPDLSIKTHNQLMPYASVWCCAHLRNSGQLGVDVLPLIRSLCDSESGVAWLDCTRTVNKDHGAHIVVLHAELKFWRRSFAKCDEWLDEIVPGVLRFARSQCKPDSAQSLKRAFQLTQFLELIGKREEPVKILEDCHLTLSRITNPSSAEVEVLVWSLTLQLGRMWALGGRPAQSLDLYDELLNRSATSNPEVRPVRTRLLEHGALIKRGMGGLNESESTYNKVCDDWTDLLGAEGIDTMRAFGGLATVYDMQGRLSESEDLQLRVLTTVEQLLSQSHVMYLQSLHDLGSVYEYRGKFAEAESSYQRCMSKRIEILGDQNTRTLSTMHNFALVYEAQGRIRDAKPMCEQVLQLRRKVLGDAHGDTGRAYNSVASIHLQTGNLAEAHACIIRAQDIKRSVLKTHSTTNDHPSMIVSANLMAGILLEQGNITEAWRISHELIASLTHILPSMTTLDRQTTHPSLMTAFHNAGIVKVGMGMYNDAQAFFQKAYDGRYLSLASDHPLTLRSLANLAWVIVKSSDGTPGSLAKAKNYYTTARISASSQLSSQLDHTLGIECFDKALFLHGECCVSRHIGLHDESKQLQDTLDGLTSVLTAELDHCLDGIHVKQALDQLKIEKDPIFDKRWERLRDIR